jgi:hypothetical protein
MNIPRKNYSKEKEKTVTVSILIWSQRWGQWTHGELIRFVMLKRGAIRIARCWVFIQIVGTILLGASTQIIFSPLFYVYNHIEIALSELSKMKSINKINYNIYCHKTRRLATGFAKIRATDGFRRICLLR